MPTLRFLLLALIAGLSLPCWSAPGEVDPTFAPDAAQVKKANRLVLQTDGRLLINTHSTVNNIVSNLQAIRLHDDGSVDGDFVAELNESIVVNDLVLQPDGRVLVAQNLPPAPSVLRLMPDGSMDRDFKAPAFGSIGAPYCLALQPDGKVLVGLFSNPFDSSADLLKRLNQDGSLDAAFQPRVVDDVYAIAVQADGKIIIAGGFSSVGGKSRSGLARLLPDGRLDDGFYPRPDDGAYLTSLVVLPDDKLMVGGRFSSFNGLPAESLVRLYPDGSCDLSFQVKTNQYADGTGSSGIVNDMAVQADGKIIIVGDFGKVDNRECYGVARLLPDGHVDVGFDTSSLVTNRPSSEPNCVVLQSDGKPVLARSRWSSAPSQLQRLQSDGAFERLTVTGLETKTVRWMRGGTAPEILEAVFELSEDFGRRYTQLGKGKKIPGGWEMSGLRLPACGQVRATALHAGCRGGFGGRQVVTQTVAFGRLPVPEIVVEETATGRSIEDGGQWEIVPANPGSPITRTLTVRNVGDLNLKMLAARIIGPDASAFTITRAPASRVRGGGGSTIVEVQFTPGALGLTQATLQLATSDRNEHIFDIRLSANTRLSSDATLKTIKINHAALDDFSPEITDYTPEPFSDSYRLVEIIAQPNQAGAVVKINGWLGRSEFNVVPGLNVFTIKVTAQDGSTVKYYTVNLRGAVPTAADGILKQWPLEGGQALALEPDGSRVVGGSFTQEDGLPAAGLLRLTPDGERDAGYAAGIGGGTNPQAKALLLQADLGLIVGGEFSTANDQPRTNLARFHRDGSLDMAFDPAPDGSVMGLVMQEDGKILVFGTFSHIAGVARAGSARLNADGSLDESFAPEIAGGVVVSAAVQTDGHVIIGGSFNLVNGSPRLRLARLDSSGLLDPGFDPAANGDVQSVALQPDGKVVIAGRFTMLGSVTSNGLARLLSTGAVDVGFAPNLNGSVSPGITAQALLQADGKVLMGAPELLLPAGHARFLDNGALDASYRLGGISLFSAGVLQNDGFAALLTTTKRYQIALGDPVGSLQVQDDRIDWQRGGSMPEAVQTWFDISTDQGMTFNRLGKGVRVVGGWSLTGQSLPSSGLIRARARVVGGSGATCSGIVESVAVYGHVAAPEIAVSHGETAVPDGGSVDFGPAYALEKNLLPLIIQNTGDAPLRLTDFSITGPDADKFSISTYPLYETSGPSGVSTLMVQVETSAPDMLSATLHVESNDADEGSYDIALTATTQTSRNADLKSLSVLGGYVLSPAFSPKVTQYQLTMNPLFSTARVRPTADQAVASITVNGQAVSSGAYSSSIPMEVGATTISVVVTALDGVSTQTYTLSLVRKIGWEVLPFLFQPEFFDHGINCSAEQPGGQTVVGGRFHYWDSLSSAYPSDNLARFHANGSVDAFFLGAYGSGVECVATLPDGRCLAGGDVHAYAASVQASNLLRYTSTGKLDGNFHANLSATVRCIAVQPDGKVLIGGSFATAGPSPLRSLARIHVDGSLDNTFRPALSFGSQLPDVRSLALQPDGKLLIAGSFTSVNGVARYGAARLNANGTVDTTFSALFTNGSLNCIQVLPDGQVLMGGATASGSGRLARLSAMGVQDASFLPTLDSAVNSLALQADGKVIVGGSFRSAGFTARSGVARFHTNGTLDGTFAPSLNRVGFQNAAIVWGASLQSDGRVVLAGDFSYGMSTGIARLENDPATSALTASGDRVQWLRGGSAPEILSAQFELSTDGGTTYTTLGMGTRISGGWELVGLSLPSSGQLRATGRSTGGRYNGSSSAVQAVAAFGRAAVPALALRVEGGPALSHQGILDIGVVHPGSLKTLYLILSNKGEMALTGLTRSLSGADSGGFFTYAQGVQSNTPMLPLRGPGDERELQISYRAPTGRPLGPISADLHIASNDPAHPDFVVHVTGTLAISTDASLAGLSVENTDLTPAFSSAVESYTASVAHNKTEALIMVTPTQSAATVVISDANGSFDPEPNSAWTYSVDLGPGTNDFLVQVTAQDGATTKTYSLDITRAESPAIGDIDLAFDPRVEGNVQALAVQPDGRIIIGGSFFNVAKAAQSKTMARLMPDGTLDTSFLTPTFDGEVKCVLVQPDGKIVIGGTFNSVNGTRRSNLARLNAGGTLDTAFVSHQGAEVVALALQSDGKLLLGGGFTKRVTRVYSDGSADPSFAPPAISNAVQSIALQRDGRMLVAGSSNIVNGTSLARLIYNGTLETAFSPTVTALKGCMLQPDGKILVYGGFTTINGTARRGLARLNTDGSVDAFFDAILDNEVDNVALQADGKIILQGSFTTIAGVAQPYLARLHADGTLDTGFRPSFRGNGIMSLALQQDGRLLVGGSFLDAGGHSRSYLARLLNDPSTESLITVNDSRVQWLRGGAAAEAESVVFDVSTDGGASWGNLGRATRVQGRWELGGLSLPASGSMRALATARSGGGAGSSSLIEARQSFSGYLTPQLQVLKDSRRLIKGGTVDLGQVQTVATKLINVTLKNTGRAPLTGLAVTLNGSSAYTLVKGAPTTLLPGKSAVLEVRFSRADPGTQSATLKILSNDVHFSPFDVVLTAEVPAPPNIPAPVNHLEMMHEGRRHTLTFAFISASEPRTYQWRKNGVLLPTQTFDTIQFDPVRMSDAGAYTLTVISPDGRAVSEPLYVGVIRAAPVLVQAQSGRQITLTAVASAPPGATLEYQWVRLDSNGDIYLGTERSQTLTNLRAGDDATYFCYVGFSLYGPGQGAFGGATGYTRVIVDTAPQLLSFSLPAVYVGENIAFSIPALGSPLRFSATGLPNGIVLNSDGVLSGRPKTAGAYQSVFTVSNLSGSDSTRVLWTVLPLPPAAQGTFTGLVEREVMNAGHGGWFSMMVTANGAFTGTVHLRGARYPVMGHSDSSERQGDRVLRFKLYPHAPDSLLIIDSASSSIAGTINDGELGSALCAGWRNVWHATTSAYAAHYNAALSPPNSVVPSKDYPQGTGYTQLSVLASGAALWTGRLADDAVIARATHLGPSGEVPLHVLIYQGTGSVQGWTQIDSLTNHHNGTVEWEKAAQAPLSKIRSYVAGIPLHALTLTGAQYISPLPSSIVLGLPVAQNNARITFSHGGLSAPFAQTFTITPQNRAVLPTNPAQVLVNLVPATGLFSGSFTLKDSDLLDVTPPVALVRRVTAFQGVFITRPHVNKGVGYFNLAELPNVAGETLTNTPQWSGKVELDAP